MVFEFKLENSALVQLEEVVASWTQCLEFGSTDASSLLRVTTTGPKSKLGLSFSFRLEQFGLRQFGHFNALTFNDRKEWATRIVLSATSLIDD